MLRRLAAVVLIVVVSGGGFGLCAGWASSAAARMACCASGSGCPMHSQEPDRTGPARTLTQTEADSCCAGSERADSTAPVLVVAVVPRLALVGLLSILEPPAAAPMAPSRAAAAIESRHVLTHVLLNVFLI